MKYHSGNIDYMESAATLKKIFSADNLERLAHHDFLRIMHLEILAKEPQISIITLLQD